MSSEETQKKEAAQQFLDRIAKGETEAPAARAVGPSVETLRKWAQWYLPEQAAKHTHWKKVAGPKYGYRGGQISNLFTKPKPARKATRERRQTQMVTLPIPDMPVRKTQKATAIVFQGDAGTIGDMIRNALRGE